MKNALLSIVVLAAMGVSAQSFAQTCASPLPIASNSSRTGDTCTATNSLVGYGAVPSPQTEIIYSFVAQSANATISVLPNTFGATVFLMPSPCSSSTDIIAAGDASSPMPVQTLTNGQTYYVIVTADPGSPAATCGAFTATVNGTLPVSLKNFSVE